VDHVQKLLEKDELLGRAQAGANHHAVVCAFAQAVPQYSFGVMAGADQASVDLISQRANALQLRIDDRPERAQELDRASP